MKPQMPPIASIEGGSRHFGIGRIVQIDKGESVSFDQMIDDLTSSSLIFIGENHDNPEHHLIQVQILQALLNRGENPALAMEFFQEPQQKYLDRYIKGKDDEGAFLKNIEWSKNWGFDYHFYRALMLLAKKEGLRVLAINAPNSIIRKVARYGLESLDLAERSQLAETIDLSIDSHRSFLQEIYEEHSHQDLQNFEYFYQAQCAWEDTMAENISHYLKKMGQKVVVFAGNGHIMDMFGIPDRTRSRVKVSSVTVIPLPVKGPLKLKKGSADYVWLTGDHSQKRFLTPHKHHKKKNNAHE